jgi:hypothetical protein
VLYNDTIVGWADLKEEEKIERSIHNIKGVPNLDPIVD